MNVVLPVIVALGFIAGLVWFVARRVRSAMRRRVLTESITNNMPSGVVTVDNLGQVTFHNPAAQRIFGSGLGTGIRLSDLVVQTDRLAELLHLAASGGDTFTREEFEIANPQTGARQIGMSISPISGSGTRTEGALCILSDLTEVKRLQQQLRVQENFAALGEMSAGIAHEFKNALAAISGYAQMLERESDPDRARTFAREIVRDTRSLTRVVSDFLQFARPVSPELEPVDLDPFVRETIDELGRQRHGNFTVKFSGAPVPTVVRADRTLLRQALLNLLINAVESLDPETEPKPVIHVGLEIVENDRARVGVRDPGEGIPAESIDKAVIPFFTTKPGGTGLGLALVQKISMAHNAVFEIRSTKGEGTVASLTMPMAAGDQPIRDEAETVGLRPQ